MSFVEFPNIIPSSMDFVAPRFPVGSDTSLGGISTRRKFGNRQYDGRLLLEFRNIPNFTCAQVLLKCIESKGLLPIQFQDRFFNGAGEDLKPFLDCTLYPGLLWYFIEDSPPRISRVEGAAEVSNLSLEVAARLLPAQTDGSVNPPPDPGTGGGGDGGGGGVPSLGRVFSVRGEAPINSSGGSEPIISISPATQDARGSMSASDKLKLDGIEGGAEQNVPTNLSYVPSTRLLESSTGQDVALPLVSSENAGLAPASGGGSANFLRADGTWAVPSSTGATNLSYVAEVRLLESSTGQDVILPLVSSADAGLAPASGGGTANFLRADGTWAEPPGTQTGPQQQTITYTTPTLQSNEIHLFTFSFAPVFTLLYVNASTPAWVRFYGTAAARAADTRATPAGVLPLPGSEFYAELVTVGADETITLSPVPIVQAEAGVAYVKAANMDVIPRSIVLEFKVLSVGL
jgi:hypothetical protein